MLETSYRETVENYLRVAPIRSGDSVIINEVVIFCTDKYNKQGGTARYSSLTVHCIVRDFLIRLWTFSGDKMREKGENNDCYIKRRLKKRVRRSKISN